MADYKAMYYHLAGRMATSIEVLEATTEILQATSDSLVATSNSLAVTSKSLADLTEKLKNAQLQTEEMFINCEDDND